MSEDIFEWIGYLGAYLIGMFAGTMMNSYLFLIFNTIFAVMTAVFLLVKYRRPKKDFARPKKGVRE